MLPALYADMAQRGWPEVVPLLALAYRSKNTPFSALIADDPFQARVYDVLGSLLFDEFPATQPLPAQHELDAQSQARAIWTESFGRRGNQIGNYFATPNFLTFALQLAIAGSSGLLVFLIIAMQLRIPEVKLFVSGIVGRFKKA